MKYISVILLIASLLGGCKSTDQDSTMQQLFIVDQVPNDIPIPFKSELVPNDWLIHRGVFSNDLMAYYYTISKKDFSQFDVMFIKKQEGKWSEPQAAFFNSEYNEHGMSFSPDGNTIVFSSTRPAAIEGLADTWHIWKSEKHNEIWSQPEYVDIPNLRDKLTSHPSLNKRGTLYFHSSNPDYSEMDIYASNSKDGVFQNAKRVNLHSEAAKCTPFVSPNGDYLLFAKIGKQLELNICYKKGENEWQPAQVLPEAINFKGQGNPYITPDGQFLFYAQENQQEGNNWTINWVNTRSFIKK